MPISVLEPVKTALQMDMRKSYDGLVALVQGTLREDSLSGTLHVFTNRRG